MSLSVYTLGIEILISVMNLVGSSQALGQRSHRAKQKDLRH